MIKGLYHFVLELVIQSISEFFISSNLSHWLLYFLHNFSSLLSFDSPTGLTDGPVFACLGGLQKKPGGLSVEKFCGICLTKAP